MRRVCGLLSAFVIMTVSATASAAVLPNTQRVSLTDTGGQISDGGSSGLTVSQHGRYVTFWTRAPLAVGDAGHDGDLYVHDRKTGANELVDVSSSGVKADDTAGSAPQVGASTTSRYIAFCSNAANLVPRDGNGFQDVFWRDRKAHRTVKVSVHGHGGSVNADSFGPSISGDGRYVVYSSFASNIVPGDTNATTDVFVRDMVTGVTRRVSVASDGTQADDPSVYAAISANGRYVTFFSQATNLVPNDTNGAADAFVHDLTTGVTTRVSLTDDEHQANDSSGPNSISADGRFVVFASQATNLVAGDTTDVEDLFVRDRQLGTTTRVGTALSGGQPDAPVAYGAISSDGRYVAFAGEATNLVAGDTNDIPDVFLRDLQAGTTQRVDVSTSGEQATDIRHGGMQPVAISGDGLHVVFDSIDGTLVDGDTNDDFDVFIRNLG
jgi:hypothetical protein